jgi:hypothetical protein
LFSTLPVPSRANFAEVAAELDELDLALDILLLLPA